ncbi:uncharacterized protein Dsimw501_GD28024 [Drosophila simulans]|nr:uncharacterized protein Dsimw501_GD28024 [Drosophila simulans]
MTMTMMMMMTTKSVLKTTKAVQTLMTSMHIGKWNSPLVSLVKFNHIFFKCTTQDINCSVATAEASDVECVWGIWENLRKSVKIGVARKEVEKSRNISGSAAAAAQSQSAALLGAASSDPNSVVMCDRPFKCEFCGKAFKLRHHMKDHCRVHTGERPFRCNMCGKTFSRSTILKAHEKTHFPKYVRKFLSPSSPVDTKDELPQ